VCKLSLNVWLDQVWSTKFENIQEILELELKILSDESHCIIFGIRRRRRRNGVIFTIVQT
jgi:hypothetical protein